MMKRRMRNEREEQKYFFIHLKGNDIMFEAIYHVKWSLPEFCNTRQTAKGNGINAWNDWKMRNWNTLTHRISPSLYQRQTIVLNESFSYFGNYLSYRPLFYWNWESCWSLYTNQRDAIVSKRIHLGDQRFNSWPAFLNGRRKVLKAVGNRSFDSDIIYPLMRSIIHSHFMWNGRFYYTNDKQQQ